MAYPQKAAPLRGSLAEQAYHAVRRMILRGELPPGTSIARRPLAEKLGMSFLPVSEALQRLEYEGLVESWPRVGTRVRIPTLQDVRGNYTIREALESQAARLFCEKASSAERQEMEKMAALVDAEQQDSSVDFFDFFSLHERFHRRLAECSGCPALVEAIERTNTLIRTWQYAAISDYRDMPPAVPPGTDQGADERRSRGRRPGHACARAPRHGRGPPAHGALPAVRERLIVTSTSARRGP